MYAGEFQKGSKPHSESKAIAEYFFKTWKIDIDFSLSFYASGSQKNVWFLGQI